MAGADASFKNGTALGAVCVLSLPYLQIVESVTRKRRITFPYISGLLTFREAPVLLDCFRALKHKVDAVIFDGQGIAHFRKMGLAAHMGIILSVPTVGCAKTRLTGKINPVGDKKGAYSPITAKTGEVIGATLRTRRGVKPVFVSPGNLIDLKGSIDMVLKTTTKYRLPEPTRLAHHLTQDIHA